MAFGVRDTGGNCGRSSVPCKSPCCWSLLPAALTALGVLVERPTLGGCDVERKAARRFGVEEARMGVREAGREEGADLVTRSFGDMGVLLLPLPRLDRCGLRPAQAGVLEARLTPPLLAALRRGALGASVELRARTCSMDSVATLCPPFPLSMG